MGSVQPDCSEEIMRAFVLACVAIAAVSAEADADAYTIGQVNSGLLHAKSALDGQTRIITGVSHGNNVYSGYSGHLGYAGHGLVASPSVYTNGVIGYGHHMIGKRSADAEADAYTTGHAHNPGHIAYTSYPTSGYAHSFVNPGVYSTGFYAPHMVGKRSADADAYTIGQVAAGLPWANAVATGHAHNPGHIAYTSYPNMYNTYTSSVVSPFYNGYFQS